MNIEKEAYDDGMDKIRNNIMFLYRDFKVAIKSFEAHLREVEKGIDIINTNMEK